MGRGYTLIDPGLADTELSKDEQVKGLTYFIRHWKTLITVRLPDSMKAEVIPVRWHGEGAPYPCIGLYQEQQDEGFGYEPFFIFRIEEQLQQHTKALGLERLVELASEETDTWQEVLRRHGDDGRYIPPIRQTDF